MTVQITSQTNQHLKLALRVRDGKEPALIFVEGPRLVAEGLQCNLILTAAFHRSAPDKRLSQLVLQLEQRGCPIYEVDANLMQLLSDTVNSQGLVVLAERPRSTLASVFADADRGRSSALLVALDRLQDPGNAGTIVRTAEGAGATGLIAGRGTVDAFSPKCLRASMGSAFRLPIVSGVRLDTVAPMCRDHRVSLVAAAGDASLPYTDYDWRKPTVIVLGNEGEGIEPDLMKRCDVRVRIPLTPPVESLNVAAAAAVMLFEAARQRRS